MNDDGVHANGIDTLVEALRKEPGLTVKVVAPAQNQSGAGGKTTPGNVSYSDSKTLSGYPAVAVAGTPADSANVAFDKLQLKPDLALSGINAGQNLGPVVNISGTVGAARVAARHGVPALAVSSGFVSLDYAAAVPFALKWVRDQRALPPKTQAPALIQSLNVPSCETGSVRGELQLTVQTTVSRGETALGSQNCTSTVRPSTEVAAFTDGFATLVTLTAGPSQ